MLIIFYIVSALWVSFMIMMIIIHFAPEFIEDDDGNLIPKDKKKLQTNWRGHSDNHQISVID
jgi:hypothetical protein